MSDILQKAKEAVEDRMKKYGHPRDNFKLIANLATAYYYRVYDPNTNSYRAWEPKDHAVYMILTKLAREFNEPMADNRIDGAGYFDTLDKVQP